MPTFTVLQVSINCRRWSARRFVLDEILKTAPWDSTATERMCDVRVTINGRIVNCERWMYSIDVLSTAKVWSIKLDRRPPMGFIDNTYRYDRLSVATFFKSTVWDKLPDENTLIFGVARIFSVITRCRIGGRKPPRRKSAQSIQPF